MIDHSDLLADVFDSIEQGLESGTEGQEIRVYEIFNEVGGCQGDCATYAEAEAKRQRKCGKLSLYKMPGTTRILDKRRNGQK